MSTEILYAKLKEINAQCAPERQQKKEEDAQAKRDRDPFNQDRKALAEKIKDIRSAIEERDALYQKGDNYFRCRVGDTTVSADLWGCAVRMPDGTVQPKSIACTWDSSTTDPISYVNCCIQQGGTAVVSQLYCLYSYRGGRVQVNQNCYRIFDKTAAGCKRNADGNSLTMTTWNAPDADTAAKDPQASGMSQC